MDQRTEAVLEYFETDEYLSRNPIVPIRARLVSELLPGVRRSDVLDLGCGDGSVSAPFLAGENRLTLVDLSEAMLERARLRTGGAARLVHADALTWEPETDYDVVVCIGLLAHVTSPAELLERVADLVRPGGRCVVQITDAGSPLGWLLTRYARVRRPAGYRLNEISARQLTAVAAGHGLAPVARRRYGLLLPLTGRLPYGLQARLEGTFSRGTPSRVAAELLVVFEKPPA